MASLTSLAQGRERPAEAAARLLGGLLRQLREQAGMTVRGAADVIGASGSKISRAERGVSTPKECDVHQLLGAYLASPQQWDDAERLLLQAHGSAWYSKYSDVTPGYLKRLIGLEGAADRIVTYENHVVSGLLQTPDYARAMLEAALPEDEDNERRVALRLDRQKAVLGRNSPPVVKVFLDQGVLLRPRGGRAVMRRQLEYLREVGERPGVHLRIVEFEAGAGVSPPYPLTHLRFSDGGSRDVFYVEQVEAALYLTRPSEIDKYRRVVDEVMLVAAERERTLELLDGAIAYYEGRCTRRLPDVQGN